MLRIVLGDPVIRRRAGAAALLTFIALAGMQCVQDLVVSPPRVTHTFSVTPDRDTLPIVGPQGDPIAFPFVVTLNADRLIREVERLTVLVQLRAHTTPGVTG